MKAIRFILFGAVALSFGCAGTSDLVTAEADVRRLVVQTDSGAVRVAAGDVDSVEIAYTTATLGGREPHVDVRRTGDVQRASYACPDRIGVCRVDFEIRVPRNRPIDVAIGTDSGDVELVGLQGELEVTTDSGSIDGFALTSALVSAETDSGDVALGFLEAPEQISLASDSGDLEVLVPRGAVGVRATTESGTVTFAGIERREGDQLVATTGSGDIHVGALVPAPFGHARADAVASTSEVAR